jgi:hypothetical protein
MLSISALVRPMRSAINPKSTPPMPEASNVNAPTSPAVDLEMFRDSMTRASTML